MARENLFPAELVRALALGTLAQTGNINPSETRATAVEPYVFCLAIVEPSQAAWAYPIELTSPK